MHPAAAWFEPYVDHEAGADRRFANRLTRSNGPMPWRYLNPRHVKRRCFRPDRPYSPHSARTIAAIVRSSKIAAARRWLPCNPLLAHLMRTEDALQG